MGLLDEPGLDRLIAGGCAACGNRTLVFRTYVDGYFPFAGGEPIGGPRWAYDGEKFVDGVYAADCAGCGAVVFSADVCPRCHREGGLHLALSTQNSWPVPAGCDDPDCGGEEIRYLAFVPARVTYEGGRADKARTSVEPHEEGFHGVVAECCSCGRLCAKRPDDVCPLCEAAGPLRARPG